MPYSRAAPSSMLPPMPWPPRRSSITEAELRRECELLQLKLLRVNSALRLKTLYAERLEFLLHERLTKIDELTGRLEQARSVNQRLEQECEHLADMVRIMPQLEAMLSPK